MVGPIRRLAFAVLGGVVATVWAPAVVVILRGAGGPDAGWFVAAAAALGMAAGALLAGHPRLGGVPWGELGNPRRAGLWFVLALLALLQLGRLSAAVIDPESDWFYTTRNPFWAKHMCFPAYVYGAELNRRGEANVYAAEHYLGLNPAAKPVTRYAMSPEDPYVYPPPFLLLPRMAIALSDDFRVLYASWFGIQGTLLLVAWFWLAAWVGGPAGRLSAHLAPLALGSFPVLGALQYGQFHLAAVSLAVMAALLFERQRAPAGGALLAFAAWAKIFPGVLLLWLAARRRWRALAATAGAALVLAILGYAVLGPEVYRAFAVYTVPRLDSGATIAFDEAYPEFKDAIVIGNLSAISFPQKIGAIAGLEVPRAIGAGVHRAVAIALFVLALIAARKKDPDRATTAVRWLALLGVASLVSTSGWSDYVPLTAIWLLSLLAASWDARPNRRWALLATAAVFFLGLGTVPLGSWFPLAPMAAASLAAALLLHGLFIWALLVPEPIAG